MNAWFLANTKRNGHGKHGISSHDIQDLANDIIDRIQGGDESLSLDFSPSGSNATIPVTIKASDVLWLQKMDPDPLSPVTKQQCKRLVRNTMKSLQKCSRPALVGYQTFVTGNEHCFSLPFLSTNPSHLLSCCVHSTELLSYLEDSSGSYFWNSLRDTIGSNPIIINGMDVRTLLPEQWLNDSIVNFWIRLIGIPHTSSCLSSRVHVFSSHFLSGVLLNGYSSDLRRWLRKINIFSKKLLLFPFCGSGHWSLTAVFNPSMIKQTSRRWGDASYSNEVTCMVHFDSLGTNTIHNGSDIAWAIRTVLNEEWDRHYNTTLDKTSRPFSHRCLPLLSPKVPQQSNSFDCGVYTCRFAFNAIQLLKVRLTMNDIHNKLRSCVSDDPLFDFSGDDITRMRVQIHALLQAITEHYNSHQATSADSTTATVTDGHDVAMNLFTEFNSSNDSEIDCDDDDDDDDDDDVVLISNDHSSDGSGSEWSCGSDELMMDDDEPLMYECSGEFITLFQSLSRQYHCL